MDPDSSSQKVMIETVADDRVLHIPIDYNVLSEIVETEDPYDYACLFEACPNRMRLPELCDLFLRTLYKPDIIMVNFRLLTAQHKPRTDRSDS
jgi:hypothetical protein